MSARALIYRCCLIWLCSIRVVNTHYNCARGARATPPPVRAGALMLPLCCPLLPRSDSYCVFKNVHASLLLVLTIQERAQLVWGRAGGFCLFVISYCSRENPHQLTHRMCLSIYIYLHNIWILGIHYPQPQQPHCVVLSLLFLCIFICAQPITSYSRGRTCTPSWGLQCC